MKAILFMSASNCYNGFRRMYDYQILFQSPSYSLFVTWNIFAVVVENSILLLSSFQFWSMPELLTIVEKADWAFCSLYMNRAIFSLQLVHSELTKTRLKFKFFPFTNCSCTASTLSTFTHAWLGQKYFFWKDEKNVPTTKCTYLLIKLSQRWGEMSFPKSPNKIIFFIFPFFFLISWAWRYSHPFMKRPSLYPFFSLQNDVSTPSSASC